MNEYELISGIRKKIKPRNKKVAAGIGDDCALVSGDKKTYLAITTDSLSEGIHFKKGFSSPRELGIKSVAVNVSDICAMGGIPKYATVSLGVGKTESKKYISELYDGIVECADSYGVSVIGGDTVASAKLFITITMIGEVEKKYVLRRNAAKAGDTIFVTGVLGDSYAGYRVLEKKGNKKLKAWEVMPVKNHIIPLPRYFESVLLAKSGLVNACIDVSDGLAADTINIMRESNKGAKLYADNLPVSYSAARVAAQYREKIEDYALYGGEDYELLFTVNKKNRKKLMNFSFKNNIPVFAVGEITAAGGLKIVKKGKSKKVNMKKIWKHFKNG